MNSGVRAPRSLLPGSRANTMMFNLQRLTSLTIILFLYPFTAVVFAASSPGNGELLYRKHCGGCHPDPVALMPSEKMVSLMREPPAAMPAFGEDRLPESDARAIADFIRRGRSAGKTSAPAAAAVQASRPANQSRAEPAAIPARTVPAAEAVIPVPGNREKKSDSAGPQQEKKRRLRSFVRSWTVKSLRDGEVVALQQFEIAANARNEMTVVPSVTLVDYAAKVTAFEISDSRLKLELTWTWKNSPSYWKIETYQMALSEDGKKMSGTYKLRAVGGQNVTRSVWAE